MDMTTILLLFLIGLLSGGYGTIVGSGGGFIFVPALLLLFQIDPAIAAGTGLAIVLINSLSALVGYRNEQNIQYKVGFMIGVSALPGSLIGVWLLQMYTSQYFYIVFATFLVGLGVFLFSKNIRFESRHKTNMNLNKKENLTAKTFPIKWLIPFGFMMGILSSYLGIGGGWLIVPVLVYLCRYSIRQATATSIFTLCIYSTFGVFLQIAYNSIDWLIVLCGGIGVIIGSQLGVRFSKWIPNKVIMQMLSLVLILIGFRMYFG
ncbi:hypothetical protein BTS2_0184 [Bacillus sp. TS-2]|nr:hypothetical protein BTS2_0184 [Bacillus sp. TS-2]